MQAIETEGGGEGAVEAGGMRIESHETARQTSSSETEEAVPGGWREAVPAAWREAEPGEQVRQGRARPRWGAAVSAGGMGGTKGVVVPGL